REARFADPGDAHRRDEVGGALLGGGVEELLDEPELAVAPDERRLEACRLERASPARGHAHRTEELGGLLLALQLMRARVLVDDRQLARTARRLPDEHGARSGGGLDACSRVDEVAGHHAVAFG